MHDMATRSLIVSAVLFVLVSFTGVCQDEGDGFILRRHEFSVSGAFFQHMYMNDPQLNRDNSALMTDDYNMFFSGVSKYEKERMTGSWRIAYAYNFTRLFALEAGLSYEGYRDNIYDPDSSSKLTSYHGDIIGLMATLRVSWMNRRLVRVYSSAGLGVSWMISGADYSFSDGPSIGYPTETSLGWEVVPIGMSIGKRLYGIVEIGAGTVFVGGRFGMGYRF